MGQIGGQTRAHIAAAQGAMDDFHPEEDPGP